MANNKNWFDKQSEKRGSNFLNNWNQERPMAKVRAHGQVLDDFRKGLISMNKDWTPSRLLHPVYISSLAGYCNNVYQHFAREGFALTILDEYNKCISIQQNIRDHFKNGSYTKEELRVYMNSINMPAYEWVGECIGDLGNLTLNLNRPDINGMVLPQQYYNQKYCCDTYCNLFEKLAGYFAMIRDAVIEREQYNSSEIMPPRSILDDPSIIDKITNEIQYYTNGRHMNQQTGKYLRLPLDVNVLAGWMDSIIS